MKQILPIIVVCGVGLLACFGWLGYVLVQHFRRNRKRSPETFELDDKTLIINLDDGFEAKT